MYVCIPSSEGGVNAHMTDSVCIQHTFWTFKRSIVNSEGEVYKAWTVTICQSVERTEKAETSNAVSKSNV